MKVLETTEDDIKHVIVGQKNQSQEFSIANTPAMMNILSSSLYVNPLKAIVREIMFNAWDAQKDNGNHNKPIEVTVNIDNGILIRDHGKGLHQDKIHEIYCVYGASTKTNVKEATGGFGFGSKAPFSYADSFTVISYHGGIKSINLINKIGENSDGKPDRTLIAQVPTEETGIAVTVGLNDIYDVNSIVEYIKDIIYLSGMKVQFNYNLNENNNPEMEQKVLLIGDEISPGEIIIKNHKDSDYYSKDSSGIYAVYGGVRYKIPNNDAYDLEYKNLNKFARNSSTVYFGFAPDTLTPQPSRDGLNMSELSIKSIKDILCNTSEDIIDLIDEAIFIVLKVFLQELKKLGVQPHYILNTVYNWYVDETNINLKNYYNIDLNQFKIVHENNVIWSSILNILKSNIKFVSQMTSFSQSKRTNQLYIEFLKLFPESKEMVFKIKNKMKENKNKGHYVPRSDSFSGILESQISEKVLYDLFKFESEIAKKIENKAHLPSLRIRGNQSSGVWNKVSRNRELKYKIVFPTKVYTKSKKFKVNPYGGYTLARKSSRSICSLFMTKKIILVQTVSRLDLNDFTDNYSFSDNKSIVDARYFGVHGNYGFNNNLLLKNIIPAYVVPKVKGAYNKAKALLIEMGYDVIEVNEVSYANRPKSSYVKTEILNHKLNIKFNEWREPDTLVEKPEFYLKIVRSKINTPSGCPTFALISRFISDHPNSVMCHNVREEKAMINQGAKNIIEWFNDWTDNLIKNKVLFRKVVRYHLASESFGHRSYNFINSKAMFKELGIDLKTMTRDEFNLINYYFNKILKSSYDGFYVARNKLYKAIKATKEGDSRIHKNKKFTDSFDFISNMELQEKLLDFDVNDVEGREAFCRKIIKFLKSI